MVNRGGFVVRTWLLSACFSGAKIFLFFEVYFFAGVDAGHGWIELQKQILPRCGRMTTKGQWQ